MKNKLFLAAARAVHWRLFIKNSPQNRRNKEMEDLVVRFIKLIALRFSYVQTHFTFFLCISVSDRTRASRLSDLVMLMHSRVKLMNLPLNCTTIAKLYFIFVNKSLVVNDNAFFFFNIQFCLCRLFFFSFNDKLTIASCCRACLESNWNSQNSPRMKMKNARVVLCVRLFFLCSEKFCSSFYPMEKRIWALGFFLSHPAGELSRAFLSGPMFINNELNLKT